MKLKDAMKIAKETGKRVLVDEPEKNIEAKVNLSIRLDSKLLTWIKMEAVRKGLPYQTLINSMLTERMNEGSVEQRISRLEKKMG